MLQEEHSGPKSKFPVNVDNVYEAKDLIRVQQEGLYTGKGAAEEIIFQLTDQARRRALNGQDPNHLSRNFSGVCLIKTADFPELKLSTMEALGNAGYKGVEISQDLKAGGGKDDLCGIRIQFAW